MKKKLVFFLCLFLFNFTIAFGKTNTYMLTDTYEFEYGQNVPLNAYVKIFLGNINLTNYSSGNMVIEPMPNSYETDEYGNMIAKFNTKAYKNEGAFTVTINKVINAKENKIGVTLSDIGHYNIEPKYLQSTEKIESNNSFIIEKAEEITKGCKNDYEKIKKIFDYVNVNIIYDTSPLYRNKGALSGLLTGRGVCEEYSALFVALCRTQNIPARIITGYNVEKLEKGKTENSIPYYHAWPEVYLSEYGWTPLEITAEYYLDNKKVSYEEGFLQLPEPTYIVEGIYNANNNEIEWYGMEYVDYKKTVKLIKSEYFSDINNHWAKNYIEKLYDKKIINGYEDGTFGPDKTVTTIEFIAMLSRTLECLNMNYYNNVDIYYPDNFVENWSKEDYDMLMRYYSFYAQDYKKGAGNEIINHVFENDFQMDEAITREKVVALIAPFLNNNCTGECNLLDIDNSKFKEEIKKSYWNQIIIGYDDGTFKPEQTITRAEIATIFDRLTDKGKI